MNAPINMVRLPAMATRKKAKRAIVRNRKVVIEIDRLAMNPKQKSWTPAVGAKFPIDDRRALLWQAVEFISERIRQLKTNVRGCGVIADKELLPVLNYWVDEVLTKRRQESIAKQLATFAWATVDGRLDSKSAVELAKLERRDDRSIDYREINAILNRCKLPELAKVKLVYGVLAKDSFAAVLPDSNTRRRGELHKLVTMMCPYESS